MENHNRRLLFAMAKNVYTNLSVFTTDLQQHLQGKSQIPRLAQKEEKFGDQPLIDRFSGFQFC